MQIPKTYIVHYSLLAVISALAIYFFWRSQNLNNEVSTLQTTLEAANNNKAAEEVAQIDSMLFDGRYIGALRAYEGQLNSTIDKEASKGIKLRIKLIRQLLAKESNKPVSVDSTDDTSEPLASSRLATPNEVRQFDSLNFALAKTKLQVENLRNQLKHSTKGSYLTFKSSKGQEMHFVGEVKNNKANGKGVALLNSGSRYEGEWKDNLRHGKGKFYWPDGEYYEGDYADDKRHGVGTYFWPNGEKYHGEWGNDQRSGKGVFYGKEGEVIAKGTWNKDELVEVEKE